MTEASSRSAQEVERKLEELIDRLSSSDGPSRGLGQSLPDRRILALRVTDLDADWWTTLEGGRMDRLHRGSADDADIRVAASSNDLVSLIDGEAGLFSAYLAGRIRIEASFSDLMRLRRLV